MMESRVSYLEWELHPYLQAVTAFELGKPLETVLAGLVKEYPDPFCPGWVYQIVREVVIPNPNEYECRTPSYLKTKPIFKQRVIETANKLDLTPKLGDHCQPIDFLSGTDIENAWKHEKYYHNTVTGSYNTFHRFFRITESGPVMIPWSIRNGIDARTELAYGWKIQYKIRTTRLFVVGVGGIGWKFTKDAVMKGFGRIDIAEPDSLEYSNLSRIDVPEATVGEKKATVLQRIIQQLRPNLLCDIWNSKIQAIPQDELENHDTFLVFTDNVNSRCYMNRLSLLTGIPSIQVGAGLENGTRAVSVRTIVPGVTPCYECHKTFTLEQMQRDYLTPEQIQAMKDSPRPYNLPEPVPSIVDVNSVAAGLAGEALFRLLTNKKIVPQFHLDLRNMQLQANEGKRDPDCRACGNIPDFFIMNEERKSIEA
jgi:molybdopterin/thiamine biosynthesis adenylyltransferase